MDCRLATPNARLLSPPLSPIVYSNSYTLNQWCYLIISSSVTLFSSCLNVSQHQGLFQWVGSLHQGAKVLELQLHNPSNEYSGLISFRIDWFDLLAVQGTLKSLLQHHSLKVSVLQCSAFFIVQFSHIHIWPLEKPQYWLCIWMFVRKVMSLLFNRLPRFFMAFLPRSKHLLISWLQSPSAVILEPKKINLSLIPLSPPSICHKSSYNSY